MTEEDVANFFKLDKRVYVEFINADVDGEILDSDSGPPLVRHFVKQLYVGTGGGTIGWPLYSVPLIHVLAMIRGGKVPTEYTELNHQYAIVSKMEEGDEVWLRVQHSVRLPDAPKKTPSGQSEL